MTATTTRTRTEAMDALDDLRDALDHSATCELPGQHPKCPACDESFYIGRVIRDLHDGDDLANVIVTAKHIGESLSYNLDRQVHAIVRSVAA